MNYIKKLYHLITERCWTIGLIEYSPEIVLNPSSYPKIHWVKNRFNRSWLADPFIIDVTKDEFVILAEEFPYATRKGRISKVVVSRDNYVVKSITPILETTTHLSFPAYFNYDGKIYVYPENSKSGQLNLYEYNRQLERLDFVKVINVNPLADSIIWNVGDDFLLSATTCPNDNSNILDLYSYDSSNQIFSKEPKYKIEFQTNIARNAGLSFIENDMLIRPSQDCTQSYGECVVLQKISIINETISFQELKRFYSKHTKYNLAFHTFNVFNNAYVVVDAQGYRFGIFAKLSIKIRDLIFLLRKLIPF